MKQIWPNYSYSPTTNVLTLTGLNIDRDQLLLVTAADRGRIMYNFADSSVTASAFTSGANTALTLVAATAGLTTTAALVIYYDDQLASTTVTVSSLPAISGTVTVSNISSLPDGGGNPVVRNFVFGYDYENEFPVAIASNGQSLSVAGSVTIGSALPAGTNRIGVVTIGGGTVTIGAGTAQIGSVTVGNSVTIGSLPSIAGTVTVGNTVSVTGGLTDAQLRANPFSVFVGQPPSAFSRLQVDISDVNGVAGYGTTGDPLKISGSVTIGAGTQQIGSVTANTFAVQGTAVTTSNFTSTTASTVLANFNATREVLTIFNEGAGNLHICAGATCTTVAYQVRLSAGDYYEVPNHQTSLTHSAVFATAGTARIVQIS
jgi:hypothetical protein